MWQHIANSDSNLLGDNAAQLYLFPATTTRHELDPITTVKHKTKGPVSQPVSFSTTSRRSTICSLLCFERAVTVTLIGSL